MIKKAAVSLIALIITTTIVGSLTVGITSDLSSVARKTTYNEINETMISTQNIAESLRKDTPINKPENIPPVENCAHKNIILKNTTDTYSGDSYCADCDILIEKGYQTLNSLANTTWRMNPKINNYDFIGNFDYYTQSGGIWFTEHALIQNEESSYICSGFATNKLFNYLCFGTIQNWGTENSFNYCPDNNIGFESGWYTTTHAMVEALCLNQEMTPEFVAANVTKTNAPTITFGSSGEELTNSQFIIWLGENATKL